MALQGVSYDLTRSFSDAREGSKETGMPTPTIGVVAQEVEEVLPSLVRELRSGEKTVNYSGLIPVLLEAIKEQQGQIDMLENRIAELEGK
jgi:hypothetical protein